MLIVESVAPLYEVVVACGKRRFYLTVTQEAAWELCQAPACQAHPSQEVFTHCTQHLVQCDEQALVRMGNRWASDHRDAFRDAPALAGGSTDADELVRAAVHDGVTLEVTRAIADSLFDDPDMFDEVYHYEDESTLTAVRKAYAAELQRLLMEGQFEQNRLRGSREFCVECKVRRLGFDSLAPALLCERCVQKRHECTNREESLRYG
ncbi:hypothetical protein ACIQMP_07730 [Streptomyces sp. NPDC091385]|uniref:hypothetical protein n=1 Tax=Streptomyces sp. NPDC091385 TaxID=3365997 RepID=UPI00380FB485